jgi:hypothetical protein
MAIHVVCSHCKNRCALPDDMRGKRVNCPACHHSMILPADARTKATPPPLGADSLMDLTDGELAAGRSASLAPSLSTSWHKKRAPPTALWTIVGGLSLLLVIILIVATVKSGCTSEVPREGPATSVTTERP